MTAWTHFFYAVLSSSFFWAIVEAVSTPGPSCKPEHNQIAGESCPGNRALSLCRLLKAESSRCLKSRVKAISLGSSHLQRATACKAASLSCPQPPHSQRCALYPWAEQHTTTTSNHPADLLSHSTLQIFLFIEMQLWQLWFLYLKAALFTHILFLMLFNS